MKIFKLVLLGVLIPVLVVAILAARSPDITHNLIVALVAHSRVGDPVQFSAPYSNHYPNYKTWGLTGNSPWLLERARFILPYMAYEKVRLIELYPYHVVFAPFSGTSSFHTLGRYVSQNRQGEDVVLLNERFLIDQKYNNEVMAFAVLVHELVHAQGGAFLKGKSVDIEAATSAATVELLAAMCNYSYDIACRGFWSEIRSMAWTTVDVRLHKAKLGWLADGLYKLLFLDSEREWRYDKSRRFWADDPGRLLAIQQKYSVLPWEELIIPGVHGKKLDVQMEIIAYNPSTGRLSRFTGDPMPFDDARARLGWLVFFMH